MIKIVFGIVRNRRETEARARTAMLGPFADRATAKKAITRELKATGLIKNWWLASFVSLPVYSSDE